MRLFCKGLIAGAVLLGGAASVEAADLPSMPAATPVIADYVFDWSGHYIGAHGGSFGGDGMYGGQVGWNWQNGHSVYGIEGSGSFGGGDLDWLGMARLKIGYAFDYPLFTDIIPLAGHTTDHFMVYAIGGVAFGETDDSGNDTGWTIGVGVEKRFWDYLSLTLEYDYYDLSGSGDDNGHIFKAGLNFRRLWH